MSFNSELFPPETEAAGPRVYSVRELTGDVRAILEAAFESIWVEGEISNLRQAQSGHCYFVLKDDKAQIRAVMFRNQRAGMKYQMKDGDQVLVGGRVTVYEARGEYQIIVDAVEPKGLGALQKAFEELKARLKAEGLFDEDKKKAIPAFPWKVGVVTSATGAAVRDILQIIRRRNGLVSVLLHPVKVQGEGAAEDIAAAIAAMNQRNDLDVLIVGRGGGSIEDLWAFNEEKVARAIARSKIPVVSAVGHEIDFTIADFVADLRAPTPSAAAELVVPVLADMVSELTGLTQALVDSMLRRVSERRDVIRRCIERRFFREPATILEPGKQRLDELNLRLARGLDQWVMRNRQRLESRVRQLFFSTPAKDLLKYEEKRASIEHQLVLQATARLAVLHGRFDGVVKNLNAVSPLAVLDRGYSITTRAGRAVKSSEEVKPGDSVEVRLSKGALECRVEKSKP